MTIFEGGCHCGNLSYVFETSAPLSALGLRADQCSFCRAHAARNTSDPNGTIRIGVREEAKLSCYRFGLKIADFLLCRDCGVYIGALMEDGGRMWFTVNVNTFRDRPGDDMAAVPVDFDGEDVAGRTARRKQKWTPVSELNIG
ncbi:MAG TPA: hypothetical protein VMF58_14680 [Rhizomicrobium sp.]|nr:hypothetical protein [Rhizomicrobium sp.]